MNCEKIVTKRMWWKVTQKINWIQIILRKHKVTLYKMMPSNFHVGNKLQAKWYKYSGEYITQPHKCLCLLEKFPTLEMKTSQLLGTDSKCLFLLNHQHCNALGLSTICPGYKILFGLPYGQFWTVLNERVPKLCRGIGIRWPRHEAF